MARAAAVPRGKVAIVTVCSVTLNGILLKEGIPVIDGVITAENLDQAIERSGTKAGNRGWNAALAAIEMANLMKAMTP